MHNDLNTTKSTLFSFAKKDIFKLIFAYNVVYLSICFYIGSGVMFSFTTAFLVSLISIYLFAFIELLDKLNEEKTQLFKKEDVIRESLRSEYKEIYKKKKRTRLLAMSRVIALKNSTQLINTHGAVHLDYLKSPMTRGSCTDKNSDDAQSFLLG